MRVLDLHAVAEERIGFVKKQQRPGSFAGVKNIAQPLFGFADILVHHAGQIDAEKLQTQRACQHLRGHGFAGAAGTGKQSRDSLPQMREPRKIPLFVNLPAQQHLGFKILEHLFQAG